MSTKRFFRKLHLWLGLLSGLVVFILGITGCILAFEEEINHQIHRDILFVDVPVEPFKIRLLSENLRVAEESFESQINAKLIYLDNNNARSIRFRNRTRDKNKDSFWYWNYEIIHLYSYVNPYTILVKYYTWKIIHLIFFTLYFIYI